MANPLRRFFSDDEFVPLAAVFPQINVESISRDADLDKKARANGEQGLPASGSTTMDAVEVDLMERVSDVRRRGLENYHRNREVYQRRVNQIQSAHTAVKTAAGTAVGDFQKAVRSHRGGMVGVVKDLKDWNEAVNAFRIKHDLHRPVFKKVNFAAAAAVVLICVMAETVLNGYLFAQRNALGLLGGALIALLVSVVNVSFSGLSGHFAKLISHRSYFLKLIGFCILAFWGAATFFYNLAVAHFRDSIETLGEWAEAAEASLAGLIATPFSLASIESWLLMAWGVLIAIVMFLKFVFQGEYYLGYPRLERGLKSSLDDYESQLDAALEDLRERRDQAVEELQEANETVRASIGDALDALQGQSEIRMHLQVFLQECDSKLKLLLQLYRDANMAARSETAPKRFTKFPTFPKVEEVEVDQGQREFARDELERISKVVEQAIDDIQGSYLMLQRDFPDADRLIGLDMLASESFREPRQTESSIDDSTDAPTAQVEENQ